MSSNQSPPLFRFFLDQKMMIPFYLTSKTDNKILLSAKLQNRKNTSPKPLKQDFGLAFSKKKAPCLYIDISSSILTTEPRL